MEWKIWIHLSDVQQKIRLSHRVENLGFEISKHETAHGTMQIVDSEFLQNSQRIFDGPIMYTTAMTSKALQISKRHRCTGIILPDTPDMLLQWIIENACVSRDQYKTLSKERDNLRKKLRDRPVIERAKLLLMKRKRLSEEEAYQLMRSDAMRLRKNLGELAHEILLQEE